MRDCRSKAFGFINSMRATTIRLTASSNLLCLIAARIHHTVCSNYKIITGSSCDIGCLVKQ